MYQVICGICHEQFKSARKDKKFCSDGCKTFSSNTLKNLSPEFVADAMCLSDEESYRQFFHKHMFTKNGKLDIQKCKSNLLMKHIKVDLLTFANTHNSLQDLACKVTAWLYNRNTKSCPVCSKETNFYINDKDYRTYCSEECYQVSMRKGGRGRRNITRVVFERYGVSSTRKLESTKDKSISTMMERYGVDNPRKLKEFVEKGRETSLRKTGSTHHMKTEYGKEKFRAGMFRIHGVYYPFSSDVLYSKFLETITRNHGVNNPMKIPGVYAKVAKRFGVISKPERDIMNWLISQGVRCELSNKQLLSGFSYQDGGITREIDIYCPEHKLAIEFNGLYWHSEIHKYRRYHLEKTEACEAQGVQLIHIWEDEWHNSPDIVKGLLSAKLGIKKPSGYARQCYVEEGKKSDILELLASQHIQGTIHSATHYLLLRDKRDNRVRAVMTFIKRVVKGEQCMELTRFASDGIHGAFSKLLAYYKEHLWDGVKTFSFGDRCVVSRLSNIYLSHGFVEEEIQDPDYKYHKPGTFMREHKFGFRKADFAQMGYAIEGKTEDELAEEAGLVRIWNCGLIKYALN